MTTVLLAKHCRSVEQEWIYSDEEKRAEQEHPIASIELR